MTEAGDKKRIIFVDDEPHVLSGLRRMLRSHRQVWDMSFAEGGQQALEMMADQRFDVIVSDMQMPGMNGAELLEAVSQKSPGTVRIILSGHASPDAMHKVVQNAHQFLAKPCEAEKLTQTVEKACLIGGLLSSERLQELLACIGSLPTVPAIYKELMALIENNDASVESVGAVIAKDPSLSGKVLQIVNSAFYGLPRSLSSPEQAVVILGLQTIKDLTLGAEVFNQIPEEICEEFELDAVWNHCNRVSRIAHLIGKSEGFDRSALDTVTSAALFHDFGRIIIACSVPDMYRDVEVVRQHDGEPLWKMENLMLGATHAEIGAYLLGIWGLPDEVICAVGGHHRLHPALGKGVKYAAIINVADTLDHEITGKLDEAKHLLNQELQEAAGYAGKFDEWRDVIEGEFSVSNS